MASGGDLYKNPLAGAGSGATSPLSPRNAAAAAEAESRPLSIQEWKKVVRGYVNNLYFRYLLVNPKHRKVVICENQNLPFKFKRALVETLFLNGVPGVVFLPTPVLPKYPTEINNGIFVDIGYNETRVTPIVAGYAVEEAVQYAPVGMATVVASMRDALLSAEENANRSLSSKLTRDITEDIIVRSCYVGEKQPSSVSSGGASASPARPARPAPKSFEFRLDNESEVFVSGSTRHSVFDVLFDDSLGESELSARSPGVNIASLILDAVLKVRSFLPLYFFFLLFFFYLLNAFVIFAICWCLLSPASSPQLPFTVTLSNKHFHTHMLPCFFISVLHRCSAIRCTKRSIRRRHFLHPGSSGACVLRNAPCDFFCQIRHYQELE